MNASRIEALENLTKHEMHRYTTAEEINAAIDEIEAIPTPRWGPLTSSCAAGLASVSYTHLTLPTTLHECRSRWSPSP